MALDKLTVKQVKAAAPGEKAYKLSDGGGMFLYVTPEGHKRWRFKYRYQGKEKLISLGVFPDVDLAMARKRRLEARRLLAEDIDPSAHRQHAKQTRTAESANTFKALAVEWVGNKAPGWSEGHADRVLLRLNKHIFPSLGALPLTSITAPELLKALRPIEHAGANETAHRLLQYCSLVFRYAIATGRAERDPAADLRGALQPVRKRHYPAITDPQALGELLRAIDGYSGYGPARLALRLAPLVFVRPGELRAAEWAEVDLDNAVWVIPARRLKSSPQDHVVPLATQAVSILKDAQALSGDGRYVFPGARDRTRPLSDMTLSAALRRLGYEKEVMTVHGFRATARTLLDEVLGFRADFIEHQLAHAVRDPNGRAYNRTSFLTERAGMMQRWADFLDELKGNKDQGNGRVLLFNRKGA